ncbi:hypothetical protein [Sphingobium sp. R-7]|uniref:hypothetical protein n=1 Tax=Sphingobium sp. R-7 TaxID=3375449 RepID=UPI00398B7775
MSGSDRGDRTADLGGFGILAAIAICCLIVGLLGYLQGQQAERDKQTSKTYSEAAQKDAQRACVGMEPGAAFECIYEKVESSNEQANTDKDLTAQFRAADSALFSAVFTFLTLAISGLGVWYVKRTLDATLKAVEDTSKATDAMLLANRIAQEASEGERRPMIKIGYIALSRMDGDAPNVTVDIVNVGRSVATIVDSHVQTHVAYLLPMIRPYQNIGIEKWKEIFSPGLEIGAGNAASKTFALPPIKDDILAINDGFTKLYIMGWVRYLDHGIPRRTMFCRAYDPEEGRFFPTNDPDYEVQN